MAHHALKALLVTTALAGGLAVASQVRAADIRTFDIPAQSLGDALVEFSLEAGVSVLVSDELVRGLVSRPVAGRHETIEALEILLGDSGLVVVPVDDSTISIRERAARMTDAADRQALVQTAQRIDASFLQQSAPPAGPPMRLIEEITVTARKRTESMQEVPVTMSAFGRDDLFVMQADTIENLQGAVPNLNIVQGRGANSSANIFIRGLGQPDALQTFDPAVGVNIDGVPLSRIQGALIELSDVERVEVLRGPQGTLFGRNTTGGLINIVTGTPDNEPVVRLEAATGSYDRSDIQAYLAGPIIEDRLFASYSISWDRRDGITRDPVLDRRFNDDDTLSMRAKLRYLASDDLEITASADWTHQRTGMTLGRSEAPLVQLDLLTLAPTILQPAPTEEFDFRVRTSLTDPDQDQNLDHWGVSLKLDYALNDTLRLISLTSFRQLDTEFWIDIDATEFRLGDVFVFIDQEQVSEELRVEFDIGRFDGTFGVFWLNEDQSSDQGSNASDAFTFAAIPISFTNTIGDFQDTNAYAVFGEANWQLSDRLTVTGGLRFSVEQKDFGTRRLNFFGEPLAIFSNSFPATFPLAATLDEVPFSEADDTFTAFTPRMIAKYAYSENGNLYASISRGFKSGGFNGRASRAEENQSFKEETVWTYEIGTKNELFGRRLRLNAAAFYNDFSDFQARVAQLVDQQNPALGVAFPVLNAGALETFGAELELSYLPELVPGLRFSGSVGFLEAKFRRFESALGDRSDSEPAFAPRWNARAALAYEYPLPNDLGYLSLFGDISFIGRHYLSVDNSEFLKENGYVLVNTGLAWEDESRRYRFSLAGKNVTDSVYKTDAQEFSSLANIQTAFFGDPVSWRVALEVRF